MKRAKLVRLFLTLVLAARFTLGGFLLGGFLLGSSAAQAAAPEVSRAATAKLSVSEGIFDFGSVAQGTQVSHAFTLTNNGGQPLQIEKVNPACGCTAAAAEASTVEPGAATTVNVVFDTTGFSGYKVKTVRVYTNDPNQPSTVLTLRGNVVPDVLINPPRLYFGTVQKGSSKTTQTVVLADKASGVAISDIISRSEDITISESELESAEGAGKKLTVTLKENVPVGVVRGRIAVKTTSTKNPVVQIPFFARVQGDLSFSPSDVAFGLLEGPLASSVEQNVVLQSAGSSPLEVISVESDNSAVEARVREAGPNRYELTVTLKQGSSGMIRAQVTVTTNHPDPDQKKIVLPVYGIVTKKSG